MNRDHGYDKKMPDDEKREDQGETEKKDGGDAQDTRKKGGKDETESKNNGW